MGHWTADRLETGFYAERSTALGLVKDGKIVAGVIYENWNRSSIMAHMVVEGRLTRKFLSAIFDYAYRTCGVNKVICPVYSDNHKSRKLVEKMGFVEEARLSDCQPNGDIVLYTLKRVDCRFLEGRYG
ncbi:MAG: hypothetical protein AMJ72_02760 [Acidithiobacillales bacterium SM1_46]|nr:MAG: hypothetical protein AMJ72_02760 [Acidithiobacillales bacterium SM1_46]